MKQYVILWEDNKATQLFEATGGLLATTQPHIIATLESAQVMLAALGVNTDLLQEQMLRDQKEADESPIKIA